MHHISKTSSATGTAMSRHPFIWLITLVAVGCSSPTPNPLQPSGASPSSLQTAATQLVVAQTQSPSPLTPLSIPPSSCFRSQSETECKVYEYDASHVRMAATNRTSQPVQVVLSVFKRFKVGVPGDPEDLATQELFDCQAVTIPPGGDAWIPPVNLPSCAYEVDQHLLPVGVDCRTQQKPPPMERQLGWIDSNGVAACVAPPVPPPVPTPKPPDVCRDPKAMNYGAAETCKYDEPDPCTVKVTFDFITQTDTTWTVAARNRGSRPVTINWGDGTKTPNVAPGAVVRHDYIRGSSAKTVNGIVEENDDRCRQNFDFKIPAEPPPCATQVTFDFVTQTDTTWTVAARNRGPRPVSINWGDGTTTANVAPDAAVRHDYLKGSSAKKVDGFAAENDDRCRLNFDFQIPKKRDGDGDGGPK